MTNWIQEKLRGHLIPIRELREGLGRLSFVAGPLEVVRPFLGPLYAWVAACPPGSCPALPAMISFILWWISRMFFQSRMKVCITNTEHLGELFRVDAKAEGSLIVLGGWTTGPDPCTRTARWFSAELNPEIAPRAYLKGEPFKVAASLELMASKQWGFSAGTDNQGNEFIINKLQTTKFPLRAVLMETAAQLHARNLNMNLCRGRRKDNQEADDLTNLKFEAFDPGRRIPVDVPTLPFIMMNELMARGVPSWQSSILGGRRPGFPPTGSWPRGSAGTACGCRSPGDRWVQAGRGRADSFGRGARAAPIPPGEIHRR